MSLLVPPGPVLFGPAMASQTRERDLDRDTRSLSSSSESDSDYEEESDEDIEEEESVSSEQSQELDLQSRSLLRGMSPTDIMGVMNAYNQPAPVGLSASELLSSAAPRRDYRYLVGLIGDGSEHKEDDLIDSQLAADSLGPIRRRKVGTSAPKPKPKATRKRIEHRSAADSSDTSNPLAAASRYTLSLPPVAEDLLSTLTSTTTLTLSTMSSVRRQGSSQLAAVHESDSDETEEKMAVLSDRLDLDTTSTIMEMDGSSAETDLLMPSVSSSKKAMAPLQPSILSFDVRDLDKALDELSARQKAIERTMQQLQWAKDRREKVEQWTAADVLMWLSIVDCGRLEHIRGLAAFVEAYDIEGADLLQLNDMALRKFAGLNDKYERRRILQCIASLKKSKRKAPDTGCPICYAEEDCYMLMPCAHTGFCKQCVARFVRKKCPFCKTMVTSTKKVFYVTKKLVE